jgi:hypothetical protein
MVSKEEREEDVVTSFLQFLSNLGAPFTLVERPDQIQEDLKTFKSLTTDGLIRREIQEESRYIAVDVMALALPSENLIYGILADKTEEILVEHNLILEFKSYVFIEMSMLKEVFKFISNQINENPLGGTAKLDNRVEITWIVGESPEGEDRFQLKLGMLKLGPAALWEQVRDENFQPLNKKAGECGQAARAQAEGVPYILLLDSIGNGEIRQGTHFLSQFPETYSRGVLAALGGNISRVGAIFLLMKTHVWESLYISTELEELLQD